MKISELTTALELIRQAHGDIDVHLVDPLAPWRLPPIGRPRYATGLVPGMIQLGGERAMLRFDQVRVETSFAARWSAHVRECFIHDAVVIGEDYGDE